MARQMRIYAILLSVALAGCGTDTDDAGRSLAQLPSALNSAAQCMTVHGAILQAGFAPLAMSDNPADADETLQGMRDLADGLPPADTGQPGLRDAFDSIVDQVTVVKGRGIEAAGALTKSAPYRRDVGVLQAWYTAHCGKNNKKT